jgi:F-type H+-transporting ATPase subunit a
MPFLVPLPFLGLELFVGFIQALVFSTLTSVFINVAVAHEG